MTAELQPKFRPSVFLRHWRRDCREIGGRLPDQGLTVLFRKGGRVGPNAFALPDGTIIFTDEMVRLANHCALDYLRASNIPPIHFTHLMRRVEQTAASRSAGSEPNWSGYLSSHSLTAERVQPFEKSTN